MHGISPFDYVYIYMLVFTIPVLFVYFTKSGSDGNNYLLQKQSYVPIFCLLVFVSIFLGSRPLANCFGDMYLYTIRYKTYTVNDLNTLSWHSEWLWVWIILTCKKIGLSVSTWFTLISVGYFGFVFWSCKKLIYENATVPVLFFLSSYSFYSYATNTIRNGFACCLLLLAFSFFLEKKHNWWVVSILAFLSLAVHTSVLLPIAAFLTAVYIIHNPKHAVWIWVASIFVSFIAGERISQLLVGLDVDDRFEEYLTTTQYQHMFTHTGFRWDFVLYSFVPVLVIIYACLIKKIKDRTFDILAITYLLSNAVWVICIRASNSDRFAHLSWFLFPMVIAYAFVRLPMMRNQDRAMAWALLANAAFTLTMGLIMGRPI